MRNIYIVSATQVVVSDAHPEGVYSSMPDFPKTFDSLNYGDEEAALNAAKSAYFDQLSKMYVGSDARVMWTVTITRADGRQILRESVGEFPAVTPAEPGMEGAS